MVFLHGHADLNSLIGISFGYNIFFLVSRSSHRHELVLRCGRATLAQVQEFLRRFDVRRLPDVRFGREELEAPDRWSRDQKQKEGDEKITGDVNSFHYSMIKVQTGDQILGSVLESWSNRRFGCSPYGNRPVNRVGFCIGDGMFSTGVGLSRVSHPSNDKSSRTHDLHCVDEETSPFCLEVIRSDDPAPEGFATSPGFCGAMQRRLKAWADVACAEARKMPLVLH